MKDVNGEWRDEKGLDEQDHTYPRLDAACRVTVIDDTRCGGCSESFDGTLRMSWLKSRRRSGWCWLKMHDSKIRTVGRLTNKSKFRTVSRLMNKLKIRTVSRLTDENLDEWVARREVNCAAKRCRCFRRTQPILRRWRETTAGGNPSSVGEVLSAQEKHDSPAVKKSGDRFSTEYRYQKFLYG